MVLARIKSYIFFQIAWNFEEFLSNKNYLIIKKELIIISNLKNLAKI